MKDFLLLKPGAIGDLLHLTPVIRQLKKRYPKAGISILVSSQATKSIFVNNPYVDKIFVYEKKGLHKKFIDFLNLCREIKKEGYDIILNFQRSNLRLWFLIFYLNAKKVLVYQKDEKKHAVINHLETLRALNIDLNLDDIALDLFLDNESEIFAENFFKLNNMVDKKVIALNPGASHSVNRWSVTHFASLINLVENNSTLKVILIGGREDLHLAEEIIKISESKDVINLVGKINLLELGSILKRCKILVTGDTGPMHIATAVGTKVIALFGAADPKRTGPVGNGHIVIQAKDVKCVPCRKRKCKNSHYLECMKKITPEDVFNKLLEAL